MRKELLNKKESKLKDLEKPQPIHTAKKKKKKKRKRKRNKTSEREKLFGRAQEGCGHATI